MQNDFKAILSQEELDSVIGSRLKRQKEQFESKEKDYLEQIKSKENEILSLQEKFKGLENEKVAADEKIKGFDELQEKYNSLEISNLKTKIAIEYNLPLEISDRLSGNDENTLREDAQKLQNLLGANSNPQPLKDLEQPNKNQEDGDYKDILKELGL